MGSFRRDRGTRLGRGHVAASAVALALALAGSQGAAAEDPPRPPAPPAAETPKPAPRQDPAGLAALRRLAEIVPSPRSAGVRTVTCAVTGLGNGLLASPVVRTRLEWPETGRVRATIDAPDFLRAGPAYGPYEQTLIDLLLLPFQCREAWEPAVVAQSEIASRREGDDLVVTLAAPGKSPWATLAIGGDGLPRRFRVADSDDGRAPDSAGWVLGFVARGTGSSLRSIGPGGPEPFGDVSDFEVIPGFALPRRISYTFPSGMRPEFVLHDVRVDGKRLEGTSFEEALAGRARRVDPSSARLLERADAAVETLTDAGVRTASCRVGCASSEGARSLLLSWSEESGFWGRPLDVPAEAPSSEAGFAWGQSWSIARVADDLTTTPSAELAPFDVSPGARGALDATPLCEESALDQRRVRFDERALPVRFDRTSRDDGVTGTETRTWEPLGGSFVNSSREIVLPEGKDVWVASWFRPDRGPPLLRRVEVTIVRESSRKVSILTFTDWELDGRRVVDAPK